MQDPFGETFDLVPGIIPVDLAAAANNGDFVSLKGAQGAYIVFFKAAGTANDDPTVTLRQASDVAGTGEKDAAVITEYFKKQGALLTAVGSWTRVTQAAAATVAGNSTSAEEQLLAVIRVEADQLDVDNGFDCIRANIADTGAAGAQLGAVLYLLFGLRYGGRPDALPNAIAD
jgi:hypothetical protein